LLSLLLASAFQLFTRKHCLHILELGMQCYVKSISYFKNLLCGETLSPLWRLIKLGCVLYARTLIANKPVKPTGVKSFHKIILDV